MLTILTTSDTVLTSKSRFLELGLISTHATHNETIQHKNINKKIYFLKIFIIFCWHFWKYHSEILLSPGGGAERHPYALLLIAYKRMLRSLRNFLTFPKYQKWKIWKNFNLIFLAPHPPGGGLKNLGQWKLSRRELVAKCDFLNT